MSRTEEDAYFGEEVCCVVSHITNYEVQERIRKIISSFVL